MGALQMEMHQGRSVFSVLRNNKRIPTHLEKKEQKDRVEEESTH
jgi:hypothetical protein